MPAAYCPLSSCFCCWLPGLADDVARLDRHDLAGVVHPRLRRGGRRSGPRTRPPGRSRRRSRPSPCPGGRRRPGSGPCRCRPAPGSRSRRSAWSRSASSSPKAKVSVWAASAPADAVWPSYFGKPSSRIQTGRNGIARPSCSERTENEPCDVGSSRRGGRRSPSPSRCRGRRGGSPVLAFEVVKIVIARFGIVLSPEFSTASVRFVFWASRCLLGNSALTIETGKLPSGSFASWRLPPHAATPAARSTRETRSRAPAGLQGTGCRGALLQRRGQHTTHPTPANPALSHQLRGFLGPKLGRTVVGGERRPASHNLPS